MSSGRTILDPRCRGRSQRSSDRDGGAPRSGLRLGLVGSVVALLALVVGGHLLAIEVGEIPSPRPDGWSVDLTGQISGSALESIDRLGDRVSAAGAEIAVVVVDTVGRREPREFATELFNHWGIGDPVANNGILVFAALDDRAAEIVLGDGIDGAREERISDEVMAVVMLPAFRRGDPSAAVRDGIAACAERILGVPAVADRGPAAPAGLREAPIGEAGIGEDTSRVAPSSFDLPGSPSRRRGFLGWIAGAVGGLLTLVVGGWLWMRPRKCSQCTLEMEILSEADDDAHLLPSELLEEEIGSVDYRVYACRGCGHVDKRSRRKLFSGFASCPSCGYRTKSSVRETLRRATYSSGGLVRVTEDCVDPKCAFTKVSTHNTPRKTRSSSSSSSFGSRSSSSFSGGRSSGGGSSGRW